MSSLKQNRLFFWGLPLFFIISPFLSLFLGIIAFTHLKVKKDGVIILIAMIALFLGLINSTKVLESDLLVYYDRFLLSENLNFISYLFLTGREPIYMGFTYVSFYLFAGNFKIFVVISTFISYFFILKSIYEFGVNYNIKKRSIINAIVFTAFFPPLFSLSAHLNRQFLASAIIIYGIILLLKRVPYAKYYAFISALIHSTALIFLPFFFFKKLGDRISLKSILLLAVILTFIKQLAFLILNSLSRIEGIGFIRFIIERSVNQGHELDPINIQSLFFLFVLAVLIIWVYWINRGTNKNLRSINKFTNTGILLVSIIVLNLDRTEIAKRFLFYCYLFIPFYIAIVFHKFQKFQFLADILCGMTIFLFWISIEYGTWTYAPIEDLIIKGFLILL